MWADAGSSDDDSSGDEDLSELYDSQSEYSVSDFEDSFEKANWELNDEEKQLEEDKKKQEENQNILNEQEKEIKE